MVRNGRYKYVHYVNYPPQLFDLDTDPEEITDLATDPQHEVILAQCRDLLLKICDPVEVDQRAKRRQSEMLAENGGRDAVVARGDLGFTPVPGSAIAFD